MATYIELYHGLRCNHNHVEDTMHDLSDDAVSDEIVVHMRECDRLDCPRCPLDDPETYDHARQLARFDHEDSAAEPCR